MFTLPNNPILSQSFDQIDNSFNLKFSKSFNQGQYFKQKIEQNKAVTANCILIDNSKGNCLLFKKLGGKDYQARGEEQTLKVLDKIEKLAKSKWEWQI